MPEKYKPQSVSQEEWDAMPPVPTHPAPPDDDEPDDFAELFVANLNQNALDDEAAEKQRTKNR